MSAETALRSTGDHAVIRSPPASDTAEGLTAVVLQPQCFLKVNTPHVDKFKQCPVLLRHQTLMDHPCYVWLVGKEDIWIQFGRVRFCPTFASARNALGACYSAPAALLLRRSRIFLRT